MVENGWDNDIVDICGKKNKKYHSRNRTQINMWRLLDEKEGEEMNTRDWKIKDYIGVAILSVLFIPLFILMLFDEIYKGRKHMTEYDE